MPAIPVTRHARAQRRSLRHHEGTGPPCPRSTTLGRAARRDRRLSAPACAVCKASKSTSILSMLYKQFLAGEIELLCSQGEYFQRVTVLYSGASDFAIYGSWDALAGFARELERVFARFAAGESQGPARRRSQDHHHGADHRRARRLAGPRCRRLRARSGNRPRQRQGLPPHSRPRARMEAAERRRGAQGCASSI